MCWHCRFLGHEGFHLWMLRSLFSAWWTVCGSVPVERSPLLFSYGSTFAKLFCPISARGVFSSFQPFHRCIIPLPCLFLQLSDFFFCTSDLHRMWGCLRRMFGSPLTFTHPTEWVRASILGRRASARTVGMKVETTDEQCSTGIWQQMANTGSSVEEKPEFEMDLRVCRQNTLSHAHVFQFLLVCPAHALFFYFHTHVCGSSLEQTVLKLSVCHVKDSFPSWYHDTPWRPAHVIVLFHATFVVSEHTAYDWSQESTERHSAGWKDSLAIWPTPLNPQVMSSRPASTSAMSTRRWTSLQEETASTLRTTWTSQSLKILTIFLNERQQEAADIRWQALYQRC